MKSAATAAQHSRGARRWSGQELPRVGDRLPADMIARLAAGVRTSGRATARANEVFTGAALVDLPQSSEADVAAAVQRARVAQRRWAAIPFRERARVVSTFAKVARANSDTILDLLQAETGKSRWDAFIEFMEPLLTLSYYTRHGARILKQRRRESMLPLLVTATETRRPIGVVGVVAPWNFPYAIGISDAVTAVLAGNAVVLKPDNQTALSSLYAAELLESAGLPPDVLQIVAGDGATTGRALVGSADYVAFTGSVAAGRDVAPRAAKRLIASSLELGGKNSMIVLDDADVRRTATSATRACFMHAGQVCMAIEKIFVPTQMKEQFLAEFVTATTAIDYCTDYSFNGKLGSLTSKRHLDSVQAYVDEAVGHGARVVVGGTSRPDVGPYYFAPTILTDVTSDMRLYHEEVFGPVVAVFGYGSVDDAIAGANDGDFGLNACVFGRDIERAKHVGGRIRAGMVNINEGFAAAYGSIGAPAGGMANSGLGHRHGTGGLLKYTEAQAVAVQRASLQAPYDWMPLEFYSRVFKFGIALMNALHIR